MAVRDKPIPEDLERGDARTGPVLHDAPPPPLQHYSTPEEFMSFSAADADKIQQGFDEGASAAERQQATQDKMWALGQVAQSKVAWNERLKTQWANKSFYDTDQMMKEFGDYSKKAVGSAPNTRAGNMLQEHFDTMAPIYARQSIMNNARANVAKNNDNLGSLINLLGKDSDQIPDTDNLRHNLKLGQIGIRDSNADLPAKSQAQDQLDKIAHDGAWNDASSDPAAGVRKLDAGQYDGLVHPEVLKGWKPLLLDAANQNGIAAKFESDQQYTAALHNTKFNGPTPDQSEFIQAYALAHGKQAPAALMKAHDDFDYANNFYTASTPLLNMPNAKLDSYLETLKPADDDPRYTAKNKMYEELNAYVYGGHGKGEGKNEAFGYDDSNSIIGQRTTNPFGYSVTNNPTLAQQSQKVGELMQQVQQHPELKPQLQDEQGKLIQNSLVYQSSLGIAAQDQQVMPKEMAQSYAEKLLNAQDTKTLLSTVDELRSNFGGYYPQAAKALQELPDKGSKLGAGYSLLLANADNPVLTQKLGVALARPEKEVKGLLQEENSLTGGGISQPMVTALNSNPEFSTWKAQQRAMGANPQGEALINDTQSALRKLTAQYVAEGQTIPDAAGKAATDVFSNNYQSLRVHANWTWGGGGEKVLASRYDEMGKPYPQNFLDDLGNKLAHEKSNLKDINPDIISNSKWTSMPDNQGAYLLYTSTDGSHQLVKNDQGEPVTRRFSDMLNQHRVAASQTSSTPSTLKNLATALQPQSIGAGLSNAADDVSNIPPLSF